ncbi:MAG: ATP-binding protein [Planctomycetes bacterium]|nr:ATP-binding protein [Planctomycetota bacterium]
MHIQEKLTITNSAKNLVTVREFISRTLTHSPAFATEETGIVLAIDEAVANIIEHGYPPNVTGPIEIELEIADAVLVTRIRDRARPFDPGQPTALDIRAHVKAGKRNGLGLFLMRKIMDEVRYSRPVDGQNELTLVKRIRQN